MVSISLEKDLLLVALLRQWANEHGLEEQLRTFMGACIEQQKNPFTDELASVLEEAGKALAGFMPNCNGHVKQAVQVSRAVNRLAPEVVKALGGDVEAAVRELEPGDTIKPVVSLPPYEIQSSRLKRISGPNFVRAWLQEVPAKVTVTGEDIQSVLEASVRGFRVRSEIQKQAATDNVAFALRREGILKWVENGTHYRRSKFYKTERIGRKLTNNIIQLYLDGKFPFRTKYKKKIKAKARK
jgi:hypothetical protein